jgi:hypothetical protein
MNNRIAIIAATAPSTEREGMPVEQRPERPPALNLRCAPSPCRPIVRIGTTLITVKAESWVRRGTGDELFHLTEGIFTYVAVDTYRRSRPVPPES